MNDVCFNDLELNAVNIYNEDEEQSLIKFFEQSFSLAYSGDINFER